MQPKKRLVAAQINDQPITVNPGETVLQAALRHGIEFPNSCRAGGCGTCKCRLTTGKVKELTETGYLLTADEIDRGYILACQSVPRTDIGIAVDLASRASQRSVSGRVVGQRKLTHDITHLRIQLDEPMPYKAGQFANLGIEGLDGVVRSYSFAAPARSDGQVSFFVREVPGGRFSSVVHGHDLLGRCVRVDGPSGDFWMRPSEAPLMLVAGGSGLAPILAILQEALSSGVARSVTLLFGAREARDLYALEEIEAIARQWQGAFRFVPVLLDAAGEATGAGERGLVTEKIPGLLEPGSHALLCGPPAMIDGAIALLREQGVPRERIHFDRFTTQADVTPRVEVAEDGRPDGSVLHYLKYFAVYGVGLLCALALALGGWFVIAGLLGVLAFYLIGDAVSGDDTSTPSFRRPGVLTVQLWMALPLLALIVFVSVWTVSPGDPLGFGAGVRHWTGYDVIAARDAGTFIHHLWAWIVTGLMIGLVGTIPAHELTHRTWDRTSMLIGRWLLAFSFDTTFAIEHVYGHHRYVSTTHDPATAPRGRNVYFHIVASTIKGNISAWNIELARLRKKRLARYSWHNAVIRGQIMSAALVALAFAMGGWRGAAFFTICALWGKALLEIVNYMEHYGMVRNPETPVQPRHSWNTNRRISSWTMFNLTRHSHHHAQGEVPYQDLRPYPDAPMMINGYLATIIVAMIPALWHKLMTPKVLAWDRDHATDEERRLAALANARSGIPGLQSTGPSVHLDRNAHGERTQSSASSAHHSSPRAPA
jgi:NAD(P)H-flavin reductase/ferredoxin